MAVNWDGFQPYDPGTAGPLGQLPRREARAAFDRLMASRWSRIAEVRALMERNGVRLEADGGPSLEAANDWFRAEVEPDPSRPERMRPLWYAVVNDLALAIGEAAIARAPGVHWEFFTAGARDVAYQRHVLMGFSKAPNPRYNIDVDFGLAIYGQRVIAALPVEPDAFVTWVESAVAKA